MTLAGILQLGTGNRRPISDAALIMLCFGFSCSIVVRK